MRRQIINWKRPLHPARAKARGIIADFGHNVRARRMAAGLRQTDLARLCQVGAVHICHMETGQTNPQLETMALIAAGLNCTVADLLAVDSAALLISAENIARAREALTVIESVLAAQGVQTPPSG